MAEKATEIWQRIHDRASNEGLISQAQRMQAYIDRLQIHENLQNSLITLSNGLLEYVANTAIESQRATAELAASALQDSILHNARIHEQLSQSIYALVDSLKSLLIEIDWEPSDELADSVNATLQEAAAFQESAKAEIPLDLPTDKPLTKEYIRTNIWNILSVLLGLIQILLFFVPDSDQQTIIENQRVIIEQNQKIIEQNEEQLHLDKERNHLLQSILNTLQAVDDETGIFGDQSDSLVEQETNLAQTPDSPRSDDTTDRQQQ